METIQEQIETLENIPYERVVNFLKDCHNWYRNSKRHEKAYLKGDLQGMLGTTAEFPTRTQQVIKRRDEIFLQRMLPYITEGRCAVFVGSAHMLNLEQMIAEAGFKIKKYNLLIHQRLINKLYIPKHYYLSDFNLTTRPGPLFSFLMCSAAVFIRTFSPKIIYPGEGNIG